MVARLTRARPIIRAAAVAAVRRGFRMEFSRARVPGMARSRGNGAPMIPAIVRVKTGLITATPINTMAAAAPTRAMGSIQSTGSSTNKPSAPSRTPNPVMATPAMTRGRIERRAGVSRSRMAATGGTDAAFLAGSSAEIRVTITPTATATSTVRRRTSRAASGRSPPKNS